MGPLTADGNSAAVDDSDAANMLFNYFSGVRRVDEDFHRHPGILLPPPNIEDLQRVECAVGPL